MKKFWVLVLLCFVMALWARVLSGQPEPAVEENPTARQALVLDIQGPIGPATRDFISRSISNARERNADILIIRMDTPGGLDASTRDIIKDILASTVPVATYVAPEGARAASAGTFILYASHVAAMSPASNVGAATPVAIVGGPPSSGKGSAKRPKPEITDQEDGDPDSSSSGEAETSEATGEATTRKAVNDAVAYIRGLALKRGRNAEWAERAVRDADSITSEKALEIGVIDFIAIDLADLLAQADGMTVNVNGRDWTLETAGATIEKLETDWRYDILAVITSPTIAYLLLLIGVYGLILEGYSPGAVLPGVVGAICLLLALYAFQMLPVNYAGLGLILLGIILMIAEMMAPSFGALGFGGIIAMVIGSIILVDTDVPGFTVSRALIGSIALLGSLGLMGIIAVAVKARTRPVVAGREELVGSLGTALGSFDGEGHIFAHGENWAAISEAPVHKDQTVEVIGVEGLTLRVRPVADSPQEDDHV